VTAENIEKRLREYANHCNLQEEDIRYVLGLIAEERKACARLAKSFVGPPGASLPDSDDGMNQDGRNEAAAHIAGAIRKRGKS
jgi:hypothetical protein